MGSIMRLLTQHRFLASATVAVALVAVAVVAAMHAAAGPTPPDVTLNSVDADTLAKDGIRLRPPLGGAKLDRADAAALASKMFPDAAIRETLLAEFEDGHAVRPFSRRSWVVSIEPAGGIRFPSSGPAETGSKLPPTGTYFLIFLDADTGDLIEGTIGPAANIGEPLPLPTRAPFIKTPSSAMP